MTAGTSQSDLPRLRNRRRLQLRNRLQEDRPDLCPPLQASSIEVVSSGDKARERAENVGNEKRLTDWKRSASMCHKEA